uniref:Uncharacterized protein n=1 Tax=Branchiostoma floridae TaxID=7739 RepID=C3YWV6_BRAFL|eukprot:XP_002599338.1 hypothetical protein BRAFLDRAFT_275159 [Branchiostoma floridae]
MPTQVCDNFEFFLSTSSSQKNTSPLLTIIGTFEKQTCYSVALILNQQQNMATNH